MAVQFAFDAIGTLWLIDVSKDISSQEEVSLLSQIKFRIAAFDKVYSRFREDSLVTEMSQKEGIYTLPDDAKILMSLYKDFYDLTQGLMTPLIGQTLVDAGYDSTYSLVQQKDLEKPPKWDEVIIYEHPLLTMKQPALLDFGAAGKGYLIDLIGKVLEDNGIHSYCIDAGGDILHRSEENKNIKIGLENPHNIEQVIGTITLSNKSIAASAGNRRAWGEFHHILHPEKLISPKDISSVWAIADTTILADALTTALFFVPPEKLAIHFQFEYLIFYSSNIMQKSNGFNGEFF